MRKALIVHGSGDVISAVESLRDAGWEVSTACEVEAAPVESVIESADAREAAAPRNDATEEVEVLDIETLVDLRDAGNEHTQ